MEQHIDNRSPSRYNFGSAAFLHRLSRTISACLAIDCSFAYIYAAVFGRSNTQSWIVSVALMLIPLEPLLRPLPTPPPLFDLRIGFFLAFLRVHLLFSTLGRNSHRYYLGHGETASGCGAGTHSLHSANKTMKRACYSIQKKRFSH